MKFVIRTAFLMTLLFCAATNTLLAQNTASISGIVSDAESGEALTGASVILTRSGAAGIVAGSVADLDGRYSIDNIAAGTYTLSARFVGYNETQLEIVLTAGESASQNITLSIGGLDLNTIVISASRRAEKVLDAPASISVLDAREVQREVVPSTVSVLRNTTGVDVAQTGVDRNEVVLRGFNNAFGGSAYILTDYRQAAVPSLNDNIHSIMPNMPVDIERIEVVRGPGSALYGAGVDEGVIHFVTKDPFSYPGTTISLSGGERSLFGGQFRHAGVIGDNLGYKITGFASRADDWELDPGDPLDAAQLAADVDGVTRNNDFRKLNFNGMLQYRVSDAVSVTANGGYSQLDAVVLSGIGTLQADNFSNTYGQIRIQANRLFAQAYISQNDANDSFVYGTGSQVVDKGKEYNAQAQYDFDLANERIRTIVGADWQLTKPDTEGTILGRNEENDDIEEVGGYVQSTIEVAEKLDLTVAARGDWSNIFDFRVSPRAAIVFKADPQNTFRASFNKSFSSPGSNSLFLDIVARAPDAALPIGILGRGSGAGFTFERNPAFSAIAGSDLVASSLNPATLGVATPVGLPLDQTYAAVYNTLASLDPNVLFATLQASGIPVPDVPTTQALVALLDPAQTQVQGFSRGALGLLNLDTGGVDFIQDVADIAPLKQTTTQTFEVGYKGLIGSNVLFAVDAYYAKKKNFVGPLLMETPLVFAPTLASDFTAAITDGITNNAVLAGTLSAIGLTPAQAAATIFALAEASLPAATTPVAVVQPIENNAGVGMPPTLMLAYRNFGELDYWGIDASLQVIANENLTLFGNLSFVSDDFFDNEELDETNTDLQLALNAPTFKTKVGGSYRIDGGLSFNASARYTEGFPVRSGSDYIGDVDSYFLVDLGAGYDFANSVEGLRLDFTIQNILNNEHREFVGAPQLGRMGLARLTYSF